MSNHDDIQKKLESFEQETFAKLHVQSGGDEMAAVLDLDQANERTPATFADLVCRTFRTHPAGFDAKKLIAGRRDWVPLAVKRDADALDAFMTAHPTETCLADRELTLRLFLKLGALFFSTGFRYYPDDRAAAVAASHAAILYLQNFYLHDAAKHAWNLVEGQLLIFDTWLGQWFLNGCPRVKLRREEAAALALSDMPAGFTARDAPKAPWPSFMVELPPGALWIKSGNRELAVDRILMNEVVWKTKPKTEHDHTPSVPCDVCGSAKAAKKSEETLPFWFTMVQAGAEMFVGPSYGEELLTDLIDDARLSLSTAYNVTMGPNPSASRRPLDRASLRGLSAAARIAAGVCFTFENQRLDGKRAPMRRAGPPSRVGGPPTTTDVKLGLPIDVDFSEPLREYTLGHRGTAKKVQWVVRGHWRNQACGVELKEHRRTWIKPYWKGPAHLPILVRPHVLGEKDDA